MVDIFYPLQWIADKLTYEILGIGPDTHLGASVNFIIYDVMKIFVLLAFMIFVISYIRSYITPEKTRQMLGGKKGLLYHLLASLIGVISPFCSSSSVQILHRASGTCSSSRSDFVLPYYLSSGKRSRSCCSMGNNSLKQLCIMCISILLRFCDILTILRTIEGLSKDREAIFVASNQFPKYTFSNFTHLRIPHLITYHDMFVFGYIDMMYKHYCKEELLLKYNGVSSEIFLKVNMLFS